MVYKIVVPMNCHRHVLELAHAAPMAGHLGVNKTYNQMQVDPAMCASWSENLVRK